MNDPGLANVTDADWQLILRERRCLACGSSDIEMYPHSGKANCLVPGCDWEVNRFGYVPFRPLRQPGTAIRIGQTSLEKRLLQLLFGADYRNESLDTVRQLAAAEMEPGQKKIEFDFDRKFASRRTYRITGAPECDPPTDREILGLLCRARPGSDWSIQECIEDSPLLVIPEPNTQEVAGEALPPSDGSRSDDQP